jgi:type I restriction enzyme M protein
VTPAHANKYCRSTDLGNEASVESFFVLRLLKDLGYRDAEIVPKGSIQELRIPRGRARELYRPDFLIKAGGRPRWIIDAKATNERIEDYTYQCAGYALLINRKYRDRPARFYLLTNGLLTRVYVWDQEEAVLSLHFADVVDGNSKYEALKALLGAAHARNGWSDATQEPDGGHALHRPTMDAVKRMFLRCHNIIWKAEKLSVQAAFVEFAKLLFVKLWEDRKLRDNPTTLELIGRGDPLPSSAVRFSRHWVTQQQAHEPNPVGALFRHLVEALEREIAERRRKRIFDPDERLNVSASTAKRIVEEMEHSYLFGIDEDLNGRMFEAFLTATMRGRDLGQYFTPRSIVKLMTRLGKLQARRDHVDRVIDGCCGTGGFLIEALTEMRRQVYDNTSLSGPERTHLLNDVANEAIFGIDAGRDPAIARIARINMYLHGDGGSRVYQADALRYPPEPSNADSVEVQRDVQELKKLIVDGLLFDVCLTNPPFSMGYSANVPDEQEILETYELTRAGGRTRDALRSSVMFIEQYARLLKPGGRLLTVIDDSVLGGQKWAFVRDFIRTQFLIRAIISLHGDAFQGSGARVKTSVLYLIKKMREDDAQPAAFVYESRYVGLDDVVLKTRPSVAAAARAAAIQETDEIAGAFDHFLSGQHGPWIVPADRLNGRLDAKALLPWSVDALLPQWSAAGVESGILGDLVRPVDDAVTLQPDTRYTFLKVLYAGHAEKGETALGNEISSRVGRAQPNDIVVSHINAVNQATCVIPSGMEHLLVSGEYTVLRLRDGVRADPFYIRSVLRSTAVIAEWLSRASGSGRTRVDWEILRAQRIPLLDETRQRQIGDLHRAAIEKLAESSRLVQTADAALEPLALEGAAARDRMERAKPPQ